MAQASKPSSITWARMDNNWYSNPKFLQLRSDKKYRAITVYWSGVGWCNDHGNDGFVPFYALDAFGATKRDAGDLVAVGLWFATDGGFEVNDFCEYQLTAEDTANRSQRARDAARARWAKRNA